MVNLSQSCSKFSCGSQKIKTASTLEVVFLYDITQKKIRCFFRNHIIIVASQIFRDYDQTVGSLLNQHRVLPNRSEYLKLLTTLSQ
ncbi:hypothetical protein V144x_41570 [Gimesia aquarii]|uniref:Uncharacterized protein n=1 Tax=Gimesia aquarii TaxID=2527964 RepID=A0A517W084_9PLAN|nr:hypothetical protein V144x_41570 [Gimesia aquarii]